MMRKCKVRAHISKFSLNRDLLYSYSIEFLRQIQLQWDWYFYQYKAIFKKALRETQKVTFYSEYQLISSMFVCARHPLLFLISS